MRKERTILLRDSIEYLIFNSEPITCMFAESHFIHGVFTDCTDSGLILQYPSHEREFLLDHINQSFHVICNYRASRLEFNLTIKSVNADNNTLITNIPNQGQLINDRNLERTSFDFTDSVLEADLEIETILGKKIFKSCKLVDFTFQSISLYITRSQGVLVPQDIVKHVHFKLKSNTIFSGTGKVARIVVKEGIDDVLAVINLDDPNAKPVLDIEPNKRQSDRFVFEHNTDAFIEFTHPFSNTRKTIPLHDISNYGISIEQHGSRYAMPPGLILEYVSLQLPLHQRLDVSLRVKAYFQSEHENDGVKIGLEFVEPSASLLKVVSNFVQQSLSAHLQDATVEDVEELWYHYFDTGFVYKGKRRQIQANADIIKRTFRILLKSNTPLLKKILYKEDGAIKGHVTAIKVFDRTLMVQHLNALKIKSGNAGMHVIRGITSHFLDAKANEASSNRYICFYFRPDNTYPATVFGRAASLINDEDLCWIDTYKFCLPAAAGNTKLNIAQNIAVSEATDADLAALEHLLISQNNFKILRLEGLVRETMTEMRISKDYKELGLYRYRKVFVARHNASNDCVYAVATYASAGLNFSELTNSIKLYYSDSTQHAQDLLDAVGAAALASYAQTDVANPALLLKDNQHVPACFEIEKDYTLFALDVRHTRKFRTATEYIFANFKEVLREEKKKVGSA